GCRGFRAGGEAGWPTAATERRPSRSCAIALDTKATLAAATATRQRDLITGIRSNMLATPWPTPPFAADLHLHSKPSRAAGAKAVRSDCRGSLPGLPAV